MRDAGQARLGRNVIQGVVEAHTGSFHGAPALLKVGEIPDCGPSLGVVVGDPLADGKGIASS
jgi:hypothetical protein